MIFNAIFYVLDNGIKWRAMPVNFPPLLIPTMHLTGGIAGKRCTAIGEHGSGVTFGRTSTRLYENRSVSLKDVKLSQVRASWILKALKPVNTPLNEVLMERKASMDASVLS